MYHYYLFSISRAHNMVISPHHNTLSFLFFKLVKYDNKFTKDLENTEQNYI